MLMLADCRKFICVINIALIQNQNTSVNYKTQKQHEESRRVRKLYTPTVYSTNYSLDSIRLQNVKLWNSLTNSLCPYY